ncbi:DUF2968 domain-containing protein [Bordetella sp. 02P26C-1]|uniref:DUF2968 domain-containing protein n=1 Tax=Bordetella sp. 02P26C-1 TaxID=2683195 RepID=UPI0013524376|nr:DUF2968 domain-containing protein [Bordetella sp. 02P26C-1]MVW79783.1 DUF2968 domain-containing protein [Bordetella sp. 02P26C-1]
MTLRKLHRAARSATVIAALFTLAACAAITPQDRQAVAEQSTPVQTPAQLEASSAPAASISSTADALRSLIESRQVVELRTTYNGTYGASLLFKPEDLVYYVALFQQKDFWRVVQTLSESQAEAMYRAFSQQSAELAEVEIARIKLQAEYAQSERLLTIRNQELAVLRADQALRDQQAQQVAARQEEARQQATALSAQEEQLRNELAVMQRQIEVLRAQQAELNLAKEVQSDLLRR